jgi:hypothetical protein
MPCYPRAVQEMLERVRGLLGDLERFRKKTAQSGSFVFCTAVLGGVRRCWACKIIQRSV